MAVVPTTTYLYCNANLEQFYVQGSVLNDRGPWSSSANYTYPDVVQIGLDQYVAIAANTNAPPTAIVDENWSQLVVVSDNNGTATSNGTDAVARALANEALALGSTAYTLAETALSVADSAFTIAVSGTNTGTAAYSLAQAAYTLALNATNTGTSSYNLAVYGTQVANEAFNIAVVGTNTGSIAYSYATAAYSIAEIGTNVGSTAYSVAEAAYLLAQAGTAAGTNYVHKAGDTMTGALIAPAYGNNYLTISSSATIDLDFTGTAAKLVTLTQDAQFHAINITPGLMVKAFIDPGGTQRIPTWNTWGTWRWFADPPTSFTANKWTILSLEATGTAQESICAITVQQP
jgi:hypothetical protein